MLSQRLDDFVEDPSLTSATPNVLKLPPNMSPVACKPVFFDLALNHATFPSLVEKVETKSKAAAGTSGAGITGFVKGLWGWGAKK